MSALESYRPAPSGAVRRRPVTLTGQVVTGPDNRPRELEEWTDTRYQLLDRVRTAVKRGEVRETGGFRQVPGASGWYVAEVWRLKDPAPAWRRALPWVITGVVTTAGVLAAVAWVLMSAFAALAAVPLWLWVLLAVMIGGGGGGTVVTVVTKVIVR